MPRLLKIGLAVAGFGVLIAVNYLIALRLLRLSPPSEDFAGVHSFAKSCRTPLVASVGEIELAQPMTSRFFATVGLDESEWLRLPSTHSKFVDIGWILRANPYPPFLSEIKGQLPAHISYGCLGEEGDYYQVTFTGGEADSTPSILTPKMRGSRTGHGDYFVRYIFYLKRKMSPEAEPLVIDIDWSTYAGGSYNASDEIRFTIVATGVELALILIFSAGWLSCCKIPGRAGCRLRVKAASSAAHQ